MGTTPTIAQSWQPDLSKVTHPKVAQAISLLYGAIQDHDTAIVAMNGKVATSTAPASTTAPTTTTTATATSSSSFPSLGLVNMQTGTTYVTQITDNGSLVVVGNAGGVAVTLTNTVTAPWFMSIVNLGSANAVLTPSSGTINSNPTLTLLPNGSAFIYFDGVNFWSPFTPNLATTSAFGIVRPDGTSITITGGVISAAGGGGVARGALNSNSNGSWWVWSDGVIEQWGSVNVPATSLNETSSFITFPTAFLTSVQSVVATVNGLPQSGTNDGASIQLASPTLLGVSAFLQCNVPTGGGGATFDQAVSFYWRAIGK